MEKLFSWKLLNWVKFLQKKVECVRKDTEEQNKAGEMKGCTRWTCSVLPLLQSSQNCDSEDMCRLCQIETILSNIHISWTWWNHSRYNYEENLVSASSEHWSIIGDCHRCSPGMWWRGKSKAKPTPDLKQRRRKDPENERLRNMILASQNFQSTLYTAERRMGSEKESWLKNKQANLSNLPL